MGVHYLPYLFIPLSLYLPLFFSIVVVRKARPLSGNRAGRTWEENKRAKYKHIIPVYARYNFRISALNADQGHPVQSEGSQSMQNCEQWRFPVFPCGTLSL